MVNLYVKLGTMPGTYYDAEFTPQVGDRLRVRREPGEDWIPAICTEIRHLNRTQTLYLLDKF